MPQQLPIVSQQETHIPVLIGFLCFSLILGFSGLGDLLTLSFPFISFGVGLYFYKKSQSTYIRFVWWLWFLSPLIRRIADQYSSYTEPSILLLAPFMVTLISVKGFFDDWTSQKLPFLMSTYAVIYGAVIAVFFQSPTSLVITTLDWLVPVVFASFLYTNWRSYPEIRSLFQSTFLWGLLLMGAYGVVQFLFLPEWDKSWMINAEFASAGRPEPFMINVWSTMSSNRPLSTVFMAGLLHLLVMDRKGPLFLGANIFGFMTFLLARKRTSWLSFVVGLILLMGSLSLRKQVQIIATAIAIALCLVPLVSLEPFSEVIVGRLETLSNLESDGSAEARQETYAALQDEAFGSWIGEGLGAGSFDSAILSSLLSIGWFGSSIYFGGLAISLLKMAIIPLKPGDSFAAASRAVAFATVTQLPLGQPHTEVQGMIMWSSIALVLSAQKYHAYHQMIA
ncbi:O-antigen ligase domain-containing protein [Halomicronema sp. CCY15110]|uniref:O-antigen ligase domain-containing protein n=1 Tax=Halomicronema sp. CCY15110 TaxID=2767773 RepID=UPI00194E5477|nr:O-antigen ligase domain-containing protein [Halomicronema sp. CCY15110]